MKKRFLLILLTLLYVVFMNPASGASTAQASTRQPSQGLNELLQKPGREPIGSQPGLWFQIMDCELRDRRLIVKVDLYNDNDVSKSVKGIIQFRGKFDNDLYGEVKIPQTTLEPRRKREEPIRFGMSEYVMSVKSYDLPLALTSAGRRETDPRSSIGGPTAVLFYTTQSWKDD